MSEFILVNRKRLVRMVAAMCVTISVLTGLACMTFSNYYVHTISVDTNESVQFSDN